MAGLKSTRSRAGSEGGIMGIVRTTGWDATDELLSSGSAGMDEILKNAPPRSPAEPPEGASAGSGGEVTQASGGIEWGEPKDLPEALPPVLPFDPDMLPPKMLPWIADVVDRMQCPWISRQ